MASCRTCRNASDCNHGQIRRRIRKSRQAAAARRPTRRSGLPPQPRRHLVGDWQFSECDRPATCWRSAAAPASMRLNSPRRAPQLTWWPSDIVPSHLASIAAWRAHAGLANLRAPQRIDLDGSDWAWRRRGAAGERSPPCSASTCCTSRPGACRRISSPAPGACCAPAAGCSSMARSSATARIPRPAMPPSMRACGRRTRNGACATCRPRCAGAGGRPFAGRNHADAGQQSGSGLRARRSAELNPMAETGYHDRRTHPRHRPSRPSRNADADIRGEPQILRRRHGHDPERRERRQRLSARLGRLRALFAQAHRLEDLGHGACRLPHPQPAGTGAARGRAERLRLRCRLERRRPRPRQDVRVQGPGRPRHRALLRHRMVRSAARSEARAEEPGAALSGARLQRAPHRPLQRARRRHQGQPRIFRKLSRLPPDRADRARRRHRGRPVDDRHQQVLRLRLYPRLDRHQGPLPPHHLCARLARGHPARRRHFPGERRVHRDRPAQARHPADILPLCLRARRQPRGGRLRRRAAGAGAGLEADPLDRSRAQEGPGLGPADHQVVPHPRHAAGAGRAGIRDAP